MPEEHASVWEVRITQTAANMLCGVTDVRVRRKILDTIATLKDNADMQGKPLIGELARFRSIRAVGQRYRILYSLETSQVVVYVVAVGIRNKGDKGDIYTLAQRLVRLGLLASDPNRSGK